MNINLSLSPNANEFVKKNISYIESWLSSAKFKQKQKEIESWQKYPPLIDPDLINYAQTDPLLAYELNIPLPPFYDFLLLLNHGVGHNAFMRFFSECGVGVREHFAESGAQRYVDFYQLCIAKAANDQIRKNGGGESSVKSDSIKSNFNDVSCIDFSAPYCVGISFASYSFEDREKFFALLQKQVPAVVLARDPITLIAHGLNYAGANVFNKLFLNLNDTPNLDLFMDRIRYNDYKDGEYCLSKTPSIRTLQFVLKRIKGEDQFVSLKHEDGRKCEFESVGYSSITQSTAIKFFNNISALKFVEFSELKPDSALNLMNRLGDELGFPHSCNAEFFKHKHIGDLTGFLPFFFWASLENTQEPRDLSEIRKDGILLYFCTENLVPPLVFRSYENLVDLLPKNFREIHPNIALLCSKENAKFLQTQKALKTKIKAWFKTATENILKAIEIQKENKWNSNMLLDYFKANKKLAKEFKKIFEIEFVDLQKERSDIIKNWKYYNEFLKLF